MRGVTERLIPMERRERKQDLEGRRGAAMQTNRAWASLVGCCGPSAQLTLSQEAVARKGEPAAMAAPRKLTAGSCLSVLPPAAGQRAS